MGRRLIQPGAAETSVELDSKLFVSRHNDPFPDLYERYWDGVEWIWVNHGRPAGIAARYVPGRRHVGREALCTYGGRQLVVAPLARRPRPLGPGKPWAAAESESATSWGQ